MRTSDGLFVSYVPPHKSVTSKTLARWMLTLLSLAGVNTNAFKQHATRSAAAHYLKSELSMSVKQLCKIADWKQTSGVYKKFYERYLV